MLTLTTSGSTASVTGLTMGTLEFFGYPSAPASIEVNGTPLDASQWNFDAATSVLLVTMSAPMDQDITVVLA